MKNYFSASVLVGICLSGALADLPYRNFEGRDVYPEIPVPDQTTPHYPTGTGLGIPENQYPPYSPPVPANNGKPAYHKNSLRQIPPYEGNPFPTAYPGGGFPPHHHHHYPEPPENKRRQLPPYNKYPVPTEYPQGSPPDVPVETPPFPTNAVPYPGNYARDAIYTMTTVTRSAGSGAECSAYPYPPYGTGSPYPYARKA
ncbi:hypothetical protein F4808DRAFT_404798 [Astrocystis sublimbata]|nr:hypothetical protein F4808DRAFT_404798 [Astrocystis sublimbata]